MKRQNNMKINLQRIVAATALSLMATSAWAVEDFYIAAKAYTKSLPDGSTVPMWGYVSDTGGTCYRAANNGARQACVDALADPTFPGPRLVVPPGEPNVRIFLSNGLPEPSSIIIPGQELPWSNNTSGPTWNDGTVGPRTNATQRVRSFGREAVANGGRRPYVWNNYRATTFSDAGSFIYHSGTHPQKQVYMGLAGLLTKDAAAGEAYPGVAYDSEVTLFYSDIDPQFNGAVAAGTLTTAMDRHPTWFLINGEPYGAGMADIDAGAASSDTLLRLASIATEAHVVVMQGMDMTVHAEDGLPYSWQEQGVGGAKTAVPRKQYSVVLPPSKTKDAVIVAPADDRYAIYDGDGYLTNPSDPADVNASDTLGGMLRFLAFGPGVNDAPTAADDGFSVVAGLSATFSPLSNDSDPEGDPLTLVNPSTASLGTLTCDTVNISGTCDFDATGLSDGDVATFTYQASDGVNISGAATVNISVTANQAPTGVADAATTDQDIAVVIDVIANDTDPEGQPLTVATFDPTSVAGHTVSCTGSDCTYTPTGGYFGTDTFTYTATDNAGNATAATTVTVTVNEVLPPNNPPVALDDTGTTSINTQVEIPVLGNDTDVDGDTLMIDSHDPTSLSNGTVACATGVANGGCVYTPATGFTGSDSFSYGVTDGSDTVTASVTITVNPAAAPQFYFSTIGAGSVPSVAGPYDDADVYTVDAGGVFGRAHDGVSDLGLPNNGDIDGISINGDTLYVSFAAASTSVGGMNVLDEDVVAYNTTTHTWSTYFDGSVCGLDSSNGQDIDAVSVVGTTLYFSIAGGGSRNPVAGVAGNSDDADIYSWTEGDTSCSKVIDARNGGLGLQGNADIDGLTTSDGVSFQVSFRTDTNVPGLGTVLDESVVTFDGSNWSMLFTGAGQLDGSNSQDVDAIHVP